MPTVKAHVPLLLAVLVGFLAGMLFQGMWWVNEPGKVGLLRGDGASQDIESESPGASVDDKSTGQRFHDPIPESQDPLEKAPIEEDTGDEEINSKGRGDTDGVGQDIGEQNPTYKFPFKDGQRVEALGGSLLEDASTTFAEISNSILDRWGHEYLDTLFSGGMTFADGGRVVENKILSAVIEQGGLLAAFTGVSVTAGHDCLAEQSYPVRLNATMSQLMASVGVRYEAIDVAMGNTRPVPYSYCVDAHAGIDADIISWEMAMEVPSIQCGRAAEAIELFIRSASVLPRKPAVLVMDAMPDQDACEGKKVENLKKQADLFDGRCEREPEEKTLSSAYRDYGLHHLYPNTLVGSYTCGDSRFSRDHLYKEGKHYPKPMSWHPGPHGHQVVADILFMHYGRVLLNALERLEAVSPGCTGKQLREETPEGKQKLVEALGLEREQAAHHNDLYMGAGRGRDLPGSRFCTGWRLCEGAGDYRCAVSYDPVSGPEGSSLLGMVPERVSIINKDKSGFVTKPANGSWALSLNEEKPNILNYFEAGPPEEGSLPIDRKWVLIGDKNSGPIEFRFETRGLRSHSDEAGDGTPTGSPHPRVNDSRVVVCKPDFIDRVGLGDETGVKYSIDGVETRVVRKVEHFGIHVGSCALLEAEVGVGEHVLRVEALKAGQPFVGISHVVYPA